MLFRSSPSYPYLGYKFMNPCHCHLAVANQVKSLADAIKKNPALAVPIEQLNQGHINAATAGAFFSNIQEERQNVELAMQQIYGGADVKKALDEAEADTNTAISKTNSVSGNLLDYKR